MPPISIDPATLTVGFLTSFAGMLLMIPVLTEMVKNVLFWDDSPWRNRLMPPVALVVGLLYGTVCARLTGGDPGGLGLQGLAIAGLAASVYRPVTGPAISKARAFLNGGRRSATGATAPETPEPSH